MSKEIKDYLHLYLGCDVLLDGHSNCQLTGFQDNKPVVTVKKPHWKSVVVNEIHLIKPILRPLSDMTEKERKEASFVRGDGDGFMNNVAEAHEFKYLLKQGFDLFALIESGIAIDKTKL